MRTIVLLLASVCLLLSSSYVLALLEDPLQCLPYRQNIEGCLRELNSTTENPTNFTGIDKLVPTCCKNIIDIKDACLVLYFPGKAPVGFLLKTICIILGKSPPPAPPAAAPPPTFQLY